MRSLLLFAASLVSGVAAFSFNAYDLGFHGIYPRQKFHTVDLEPPAPKITRWDSRCDSGNLLLTPRGPSVKGPARGPVMLDARGELIWMDNKKFEQAMNLDVQEYKGQDYLTFWTKTKKTAHSKSKKSYVLVGQASFPCRVLGYPADLSAKFFLRSGPHSKAARQRPQRRLA